MKVLAKKNWRNVKMNRQIERAIRSATKLVLTISSNRPWCQQHQQHRSNFHRFTLIESATAKMEGKLLIERYYDLIFTVNRPWIITLVLTLNFICMCWKLKQDIISDTLIPICWLFGIVSSMSKENVVIVKEKETMNQVVWSMPYVSFCY